MLCNQFAAGFLVPDPDFDRRLKQLPSVRELNIEELSRRYHVSREVILRKLLDRKRITQAEYEQKVEEWVKRAQYADDKKNGGGNYYLTQGVYLSKRYVELAFSQLYKNKITIEQLANYLGVKTKNVPSLETSLLQQGVVARSISSTVMCSSTCFGIFIAAASHPYGKNLMPMLYQGRLYRCERS
jgi:hypothetical protein